MRLVITSPTLSESRQCKVLGLGGSLRPEKWPWSVMGEFLRMLCGLNQGGCKSCLDGKCAVSDILWSPGLASVLTFKKRKS